MANSRTALSAQTKALRRNFPLLIGGGLCLLLLALCLALAVRRWENLPEKGSIPERSTPKVAVRTQESTAPARETSEGVLEAVFRRFASGKMEPETARSLLEEAAARLASMPRAESTAALKGRLDGGHNATTGLGFKVGPGGRLSCAPTLRTWMLDQYGALDASAAAAYSATVYARRDSADEWAMALRNDWLGSQDSDRIERVRARVLELMQNSEWAGAPGEGFLEAVDLVVATLAWEAVPRLEAWLAESSTPALRHAAAIALDRLALEVPADFLDQLSRHGDWLESQPTWRASLFARADLSVGAERRAVESYLLRPQLDAAEARCYFEVFPNTNAFLSHNLVTSARTVTLARAARLDQAALAAVSEWLTQPAYSRWNAELTAAAGRLAENVAAARRGGSLNP